MKDVRFYKTSPFVLLLVVADVCILLSVFLFLEQATGVIVFDCDAAGISAKTVSVLTAG